MAILREQLQFIRSPKNTIISLGRDPDAALVGFKHILLLAVLWEFALVLWVLGGAVPTMPAFLRIPDEKYYLYQLIYYIPMFLIAWLLASSIAYVLSKVFGGNGSYDTILGGFGMAGFVSGYFALVPDFIQGVLWTTGWVPFAEYQQATGQGLLAVLVGVYILAYLTSYLVLYTATIRYSQNLGLLKSAMVATISYFVSASIFITIVR